MMDRHTDISITLYCMQSFESFLFLRKNRLSMLTFLGLVCLLPFSFVTYGQTLNRANITFVASENLVYNTFVNGSAYNVSNYSASNVVISGFQIPDSISEITSIDESLLEDISVFPNPFHSSINLKTSDNFFNAELILFDLLGKQHYSQLNFRGGVINFGDLASGVYYLKILRSSNQNKVIKLVRE
jgi:hypothetical protein